MKLISQAAAFFLIITGCNSIIIFGNALDKEAFENFNLSTVEILHKYGYPVETHRTVTNDGYFLTLHRIPHGKNSEKRGVPILVAHGLLGDSSQFVLHGSNSLGPYLADHGYDVWLINFRGSNYSKSHKYLSPEESKFWDFSLQEHGIFDLPAHVDYIRNHTQNQDMLFLGYSLGTTAFFIMASERPEYQKKIIGATLLAPMATMKHSQSPLWVLAPFGNVLKVFTELHLHGEFYIDPRAYSKFAEKTCRSKSKKSKFCERMLLAITTGAVEIFDQGVLRTFVSHYPSSTSTKVLIHYGQLVKSGKFRQYDYGALENMIQYKEISPPEYDLKMITTPMSLFAADSDIFASPTDVQKTISVLPTVKNMYLVKEADFSHSDFIMGPQNKEVLYPEIVRWVGNLIQDHKQEKGSHEKTHKYVFDQTTLEDLIKRVRNMTSLQYFY